MIDPIRQRALLADLGRRLALRNLDELRVVDAILLRLELGAERYGALDLARPRDWATERREELLDAMIYDVADQLAAHDRATAELQELARAEMVGFAPAEDSIADLAVQIANAGVKSQRVAIPADRVDLAEACGLTVQFALDEIGGEG